MRTLNRLAVLVIFTLCLTPATVFAASANVSRSFGYAAKIPANSLVSIDSGHSNEVVLANISNQDQLVGVALENSESLIALNPGTNRIQVATTGTAVVLVSNVNGNISSGDQVSVSPFDGIGMKASPATEIIGIAQKSFSSTTVGATAETATETNGQKSTVLVGYIPVTIEIGKSSSAESSQQLNALQRFGKSLTGRTIPTYRIVLSLIVAVVSFFGLITLIYASIYGSVISIGRNPLAKESIFKTLRTVLIMVVITALVASAVIFLLLS